jgi:urea transport system permease protein
LVRSNLGHAIRALGENEERAEFLGYNVPLMKVGVFAISCALAGLAGALYVPLGFISPDLLGMERSASVLVWVAVGGRGSIAGPFIGALGVNYLQTFLSDQFVTFWLLFVGVLSVVVVLAWPSGVAGLFKTQLFRRLTKRIGFPGR